MSDEDRIRDFDGKEWSRSSEKDWWIHDYVTLYKPRPWWVRPLDRLWVYITRRQEERPSRIGWNVCVFCIRVGWVVGPEFAPFKDHRVRLPGEYHRWSEIPLRHRFPLNEHYMRRLWWDE